MKFLFIIDEVFTQDLARRLRDEGHEVRCFFKSHDDADIFDGIVEKVGDWRPYARKKDWIFIFEDTKRGRMQDKLRNEGKLVVGGSAGGERLELDRAFGQEVCRSIGLPVVPYRDFRDFDSAITYVREHPARWVMKKSGRVDARAVDYKGYDPEGRDVIARLEFLKGHWNPKIQPHFQLQEFIEGVEVGIGAWFNGKEWVMPATVSFEHQPLMPGEIGPNTGEMYTTAWNLFDRNNRMFREILEPLTEFFRGLRHVGYVDLNGIVNASGFHPLEWTVRFGMPLVMLQYRLLAGRQNFGEFFDGLARGSLGEYRSGREYCVGAVVAAPPFPFGGISEGLLRRHQLVLRKMMRRRSDPVGILFGMKFNRYEELSRGIPISMPEDEAFREHVHFVEVRKENGTLITTGTEGYCLIVTDLGSTPEEAGQRVLGRIEKIHGLPWIYRNDLGVGESAKLRILQGYGYGVMIS
jgi:phosphoribosylamine--glycine ligase